MRSIAYITAIPTYILDTTQPTGGDDATDAQWFKINKITPSIELKNKNTTVTEQDLAFDHAQIIRDAIQRIAGKLKWTDIATHFVGNGKTFTITQLRRFSEQILSLENNQPTQLDPGNFHRDYKKWVDIVPNSKSKKTHGAHLYQRKI